MKNKKELNFPDKKYDIIYADPPWQYRAWTGTKHGKSTAEKHYKTMNKKDIQDLPVSDIAADNSVLFLWVTAPCLKEGLDLIESWGFKYKTMGFTWVKRNKKANSWFWGMGYYTRANAEYCLLATRGKPLERKSHSVHQVLDSRIMRHSKKPDEARKRIVELFGDRPRIELFARDQHSGWDCWGDEVNTETTFFEFD